MIDKEALLKEISDAFDGVPVPEDRTLYQAEACDNYEDIDQSKDHKGKWQDLPDKHILDCQYSALNFLDKYGMQYYLPAIMSFVVRNIDNEALVNDLPESVYFTLDIYEQTSINNYQIKRFSLFDKKQKKACYNFLLFGKEECKKQYKEKFGKRYKEMYDIDTYDIDRALRREFWK